MHTNALQCVHNLSLQSNMLFPKSRPGNQLSSIKKHFLKQSHMKLFHLRYRHAICVSVSFTVFVKIVRKCASVPWRSLNFSDSIDVTCVNCVQCICSTSNTHCFMCVHETVCITLYCICIVHSLHTSIEYALLTYCSPPGAFVQPMQSFVSRAAVTMFPVSDCSSNMLFTSRTLAFVLSWPLRGLQ